MRLTTSGAIMQLFVTGWIYCLTGTVVIGVHSGEVLCVLLAFPIWLLCARNEVRCNAAMKSIVVWQVRAYFLPCIICNAMASSALTAVGYGYRHS